MKVQRLFLRNVRNIKSLDLDFRDPFTNEPMSRIVLAGANGTGKTTILDNIYMLLMGAEHYGSGGILHYGDYGDDSQAQLVFDIKIGKKPVTLSVLRKETEPLIDRSHYDEDAILGKTPSANRPWFAKLSETIKSSSNSKSTVGGSVMFFPHDRFLPNLSQGESRLESDIFQWAYRYSTSTEWKGSTESFLFSLNYLDLEDYRNKGHHPDRFGQTVKLVNSILDSKTVARIEKGRIVIETTDGKSHGLSDLSSGEKQLLLLLIEILRRIVPGSVILIDEPEISLHPAWQRGMVVALDKIIEQYDAQVIMATHSPEIASMVLPHEVIFLSDLNAQPGQWKPEHEVVA